MSIKGADYALSVVGRWCPSDVAFIEAVEYTAQTSEREAEVRLTGVLQRRDLATGGWPSDDAQNYRIHLRFVGVSKFSTKGLGGPPSQIMGFDILDVSDRGW